MTYWRYYMLTGFKHSLITALGVSLPVLFALFNDNIELGSDYFIMVALLFVLIQLVIHAATFYAWKRDPRPIRWWRS